MESNESSPVSNMGTDKAIDKAAKKIAKIHKEMEAIAKNAEKFASAMSDAYK